MNATPLSNLVRSWKYRFLSMFHISINAYFTRAEKAPAVMSGVQCCYVYIRVYDVEFNARNRLVRLYGLTS